MKNISKRIMALVLAAVMVLTSVPTMASADFVTLKAQIADKSHEYVKVTAGQQIQLVKEDGSTLETNDVTGSSKDWSLNYKTGRNNGNWEYGIDSSNILKINGQSNIPTAVLGGEPGYYWIQYTKSKKGVFNWYYELEEQKYPVEYSLEIVNEGLTENDVEPIFDKFAQEATESETGAIQGISAGRYVKNSFEKDEMIYTLNADESYAEVSGPIDGKITVNVTVKYDVTPVKYYQTVKVDYKNNGKPNEVVYNDVVVKGASLNLKAECAKDATFDVKDYVKELVKKGDKYFALDEKETKVEGLDFVNRQRTVVIKPVYKETKVTTLKFEKEGKIKLCDDKVVIRGTVTKDNANEYAESFEGYILNKTEFEDVTDKKQLRSVTYKYRVEKTYVLTYEKEGGAPHENKTIAPSKQVKESAFTKTEDYIEKIDGYVFKEVKVTAEGYKYIYRLPKDIVLKYEIEGKQGKEAKLCDDVKVNENDFTNTDSYKKTFEGYDFKEVKEEKDGYKYIYVEKASKEINYVHQLFYHVANGQGEYAIKFDNGTMAKVDKKVDYKKAKDVYEAYKSFAKEGYVLDTFYLGDEAIKYDEKTNTLYFNYWARVIDVYYEADGISNLYDSVRKVINFKDFEVINENTDFTEWLDKNINLSDIKVGNDVYAYDSYTKDLALKQYDRNDYCFIEIHAKYKLDDIKSCQHENYKYTDNNRTYNEAGHRVNCAKCNKLISEKEDHEYDENGVCKFCGHEKLEETIYATKMAVADFTDETIDRIFRDDIKPDLERKTDAYFEELDPNSQWMKADLKDVEFNFREISATEREYFASVDFIGVHFNYIANVSLLQSSGRKRQTKIKDPLVAQGSELLNDLRTNRPNDLITRAEFVGVLANIFNVPEDRDYTQNWDLTGCDQEELIKRLSTYVIVKGYSTDEFGQNDSITKEQMYLILARALKFQGKCADMTEEQIAAELANAVNGETVSKWAREGVSIALKMGLAAATETTPTEPQGNVMRATAADTLEKYIEVVATATGETTELKVVEG